MANEADVLNNILEWSKERSIWQQYALFNLYNFNILSDEDLNTCVDICKGKIIETKKFSEIEIINLNNVENQITISAISNVENVNALATGQRLPFGDKGMTIIYGDNGSGKSGYIRILKQVCRARSKENIIKNIYETSVITSKAHVHYRVNGQEQKPLEWVEREIVNSPLSTVSIFDSATANVHVDATNDIAYVPFSIKLLMTLAAACKQVASKIKTEIDLIKARTPDVLKQSKINPNTAVGKILLHLTGNTSISDIEGLSKLSEEENKRYETLCVDLSIDSQKIIKELNAKLGKINSISSKKDSFLNCISDENCTKLKVLHNTYEQCRKAAAIAATQLFDNEPLPGVGNDPWKILWDSAKHYSEQAVYIGIEYPNTNNGARCVLCQQSLESDAVERMRKFHAFVVNDTKQREKEAYVEYETFVSSLTLQNIKIYDLRSIVSYIDNEIGNSALAKKIREFWTKSMWRRRAIFRLNIRIPDLPIFPETEFKLELENIQARLNNLVSHDFVKKRAELESERNELEARKNLGLIKNDVLAEINRKQSIEALETIIKNETMTDTITRKSTEISKLLVTDMLRAQFTREVDALHLSSLAIELQQTGSGHASPQFRVTLTSSPKTKVGTILSEGEFRCVAIASFLAELSTTENKSTIVFDDPISSLDHRHRQAVAERLSKEATNRQIIVFTHNIEFLFYLTQACHDAGAILEYQHLTKRPKDNATGLCHRGAPPKAQNVSKRIENLKNRLPNEQYHFEHGDESKWYVIVRSFHDDLRYAWEQAVEEVIKPVLSRFSNQVTTPGFVKLTCITIDDCKTMRDAMNRIADWHHSDATDLNRNIPAPADIEKEIGVLEQWFNDLKSKQNSTKSV